MGITKRRSMFTVAASMACLAAFMIVDAMPTSLPGLIARQPAASTAPVADAAHHTYMSCAQIRITRMNACLQRAGPNRDRASACRRRFMTKLTAELSQCAADKR